DVLLAGKESWRIHEPGVVYWAFPLARYRWSRDGKYLYYSVIVNPRALRPSYETWRLDLASGQAQRMPWENELIMDTTPDGRCAIFVRTKPGEREEKVGPYTYRERDVLARDLVTGREILLAEKVMIRAGLMSVGITFDEAGRKLALPLGDMVYLDELDRKSFVLPATLVICWVVRSALCDPSSDYMILGLNFTYLQASRFFPPKAQCVLLWLDLNTRESVVLWPSNFNQ